MPLTDDDIKQMATTATTGEAEKIFKKSVASFIRQQQTFARHTQSATEFSQRIWDSIQAVPNVTGTNPADTMKKQLDSLRRRVIPKLKDLKMVVDALVEDPIFKYLDPKHELRTVREYKPKNLAEAYVRSLTKFREATGNIYRMNEISPLIPEQATHAFEGCVGNMNDRTFSQHVGWKIPAVVIQEIQVGPFFGLVNCGAGGSSGGYRRGFPYVFPAAGSRLVRYHNGWYWHPHVDASGTPCFGNMARTMEEVIRAADYWTAADLLDSILESWNPDSPYCPLGLFGDDARKMRWMCACGRSVEGAEPRNERTGVSFMSCTSCAADVCSKCVQYCLRCEGGALCRSCQMKALEIRQGRPDRPYGSVCPECYENMMGDPTAWKPFELETPTDAPAP
jgi:hypothetical protein